ncbi:MAG: YHS domain-containing protein [Gemmataceae bacterium]
MRVRCLTAVALVGLLALPLAAADKDREAAKEELQKLSEFVGRWTTSGEGKVDGKKQLWKETWEWGWKFGKDGDAWFVLAVKDGKVFTAAEVRYDAAKKGYAVSATDAKGGTQEFAGTLDKKGVFALERKDGKSGDVHKLKLSTAAEGVRLNAVYEVQAGGKGLADTVYKAAGNKEGESIAGGKKKPACIVTGGAATIQVSYQGKTYYVCCSGCKDEFDANPKKYVDAAAKK